MKDLEQRLLAAHAAHDQQALITLYEEAANTSSGDEAVGFYLTHAYVFALELGDPHALHLHERLRKLGREH